MKTIGDAEEVEEDLEVMESLGVVDGVDIGRGVRVGNIELVEEDGDDLIGGMVKVWVWGVGRDCHERSTPSSVP